MVLDLFEMLDLVGIRLRLVFVSVDVEVVRRKLVLLEIVVEDSCIGLFLVIDENYVIVKMDSQFEDLGYCVFNKYIVLLLLFV